MILIIMLLYSPFWHVAPVQPELQVQWLGLVQSPLTQVGLQMAISMQNKLWHKSQHWIRLYVTTNSPSRHVAPVQPVLQVQWLGLVHAPLTQVELQMAKNNGYLIGFMSLWYYVILTFAIWGSSWVSSTANTPRSIYTGMVAWSLIRTIVSTKFIIMYSQP